LGAIRGADNASMRVIEAVYGIFVVDSGIGCTAKFILPALKIQEHVNK